MKIDEESGKIEKLQKIIPHFYYQKLIDNKFTEKNLVDLVYEIEESEGGENFQIVEKPEGDKQKDLESSLSVWINQTCNGGYTGDEFAGWVFIKINEKEYLSWHYCM